MFAIASRLRLTLSLVTGLVLPALVSAAVEDKDSWCDESHDHHGSGALFCEVRQITLPVSRALSVDGGLNGGIKVVGWDRAEILVHAKVEVWAEAQDDAEAIASRIQVSTTRGAIMATGPKEGTTWGNGERRQGWGVSYRLYVPRRTDLTLDTHNGGISIEGVSGRLQLEALNGGLALSGVGGDVYGRTTNGGLAVELDGDRWHGEGLDLQTTNGGIALRIPARYSARLETGTTNGRIDLDYPMAAGNDLGRSVDALGRRPRRFGTLRVDLGKSGAPVRVITTNGSVKVARAE